MKEKWKENKNVKKKKKEKKKKKKKILRGRGCGKQIGEEE